MGLVCLDFIVQVEDYPKEDSDCVLASSAPYVLFEREAREYLFPSSLTQSIYEFEREVRE